VKYSYCLLDYGVLAHGDFFGSIFSFCVTVLEMAPLTPQCRMTILTATALVLTAGVRWDRTNVFVFLVPVLISSAILVASWVGRPSSVILFHST